MGLTGGQGALPGCLLALWALGTLFQCQHVCLIRRTFGCPAMDGQVSRCGCHPDRLRMSSQSGISTNSIVRHSRSGSFFHYLPLLRLALLLFQSMGDVARAAGRPSYRPLAANRKRRPVDRLRNCLCHRPQRQVHHRFAHTGGLVVYVAAGSKNIGSACDPPRLDFGTVLYRHSPAHFFPESLAFWQRGGTRVLSFTNRCGVSCSPPRGCRPL
ncbi:MAG: hypothetical protein K0Q55_3704 [Verrucomicrobia bacterium]|nr:hypothetical protein [Verrucomicrobiota bacterium]